MTEAMEVQLALAVVSMAGMKAAEKQDLEACRALHTKTQNLLKRLVELDPNNPEWQRHLDEGEALAERVEELRRPA